MSNICSYKTCILCIRIHQLTFTSITRRIQVGNGEYVGVLFVIPVIITIQDHIFEIFMLVSEIHESVDLVLCIKSLYELEGMIDSKDSCLSFLIRSIPFFAKEAVEVQPKEQKVITIEVPFVEEISGMAITKLLDKRSHIAIILKLKFIRNRATLKVTNSTDEKVTFNPDHLVGVVDLVSLGYYKIKQEVLQQNLSHYHLEPAKNVCHQYDKLINTLRKEEQEASVHGKDKYPWLDDSDERKHRTDREILDKHINLDNSCLTRHEKKKVRRLIYKYKDTFSLRDEIGTCPNIEIEIEVTDRSPFFIRPFHAREEDKAILDIEMKRLCYLGILKGFSAYSSPVMLISRKLM